MDPDRIRIHPKMSWIRNTAGKHHHGRSSSPPNKGGGSRHHHNHHFSDDVNAHTDLESMITPTARDAYRSLIEGGGGADKSAAELFGKQPAEPNSPVHYRSETLTLTTTFSAPAAAASHRLSLPPTASAFSRLAEHCVEEGGAGGAAASNPLPLPPKDRKSSVTAGKRHVRKNPLIIPSGAAASMARRAEDSTGMRGSLLHLFSF